MQNCAQFFYHESCGQCMPCREGTKRMLETFNWWTAGAGSEDDLELLESLGDTMALASKCGLGQFAGVAFKTSLPLFEDEYQGPPEGQGLPRRASARWTKSCEEVKLTMAKVNIKINGQDL